MTWTTAATWRDVPAAQIGLWDDPVILDGFRNHGSRFGPVDDLSCAVGDFRVDVYDAARAEGLYTPRATSDGWEPNVDAIPWRRDWNGPPGRDSNVIVREEATGHQWGVGGIPWWSPHRLPLTRTLVARAIYGITIPKIDEKGRISDSGALADMRTFEGGHPKSGGAGCILEPILQEWLSAEQIPRCTSAYVSAEALGRVLAVAPATKIEQAGQSVGGPRLAFEFDDRDLAPLARRFTGNDLRDFWTLARHLDIRSGHGISLDATGPKMGPVFARTTARPDLLRGFLAATRMHLLVPPWSIMRGLADTQGARWGTRYEYR